MNDMTQTPEMLIAAMAAKARAASNALTQISDEEKSRGLMLAAQALRDHGDAICRANMQDMENAAERGLSSALLDRLRLDDARIEGTASGVEQVAIHFGKPNQQWLPQMTVAEAKQYMAEGHFAPGSMKPKIEACIDFVEQSENPEVFALITNPENLERALRGETGTKIVK